MITTAAEIMGLCSKSESVSVITDSGPFLARAFRGEEAEATIGRVGSSDRRPLRDGIEWCGTNPRIGAVWGIYPLYRDAARRDAASHATSDAVRREENSRD